MSIHVTDFKWEKGKNDLEYIELLERRLKNGREITKIALGKIKKLSAENKEIRAKVIDEFVEKITLPLTEEDIHRIAEEMKGGKDND